MDAIKILLENFVERLKDLYRRSYGDSEKSSSGDIVIPVDSDSRGWFTGPSISVCSKVYVQNLDAAEDVMLAPNSSYPVGWRLPAGKGMVIDDFQGQFFIRAVDPSKSVTLNYVAYALREK
jgi:hypothetical protein